MKAPILRGWWPPLAVGLALGVGITGGVALWCAHVAAARSQLERLATSVTLQQAEGLLHHAARAGPRTEIQRLRCQWGLGDLRAANDFLLIGPHGRVISWHKPRITSATLLTWHGITLLMVNWLGYQNDVKSVELTSRRSRVTQTIILRPGDAYPSLRGAATWAVAEPGWPAPAPPRHPGDVSRKITLRPGLLKQGTKVCLKYVNGHESHFVPLLFYPMPGPGKSYHP